jgi:hypothetical protein
MGRRRATVDGNTTEQRRCHLTDKWMAADERNSRGCALAVSRNSATQIISWHHPKLYRTVGDK